MPNPPLKSDKTLHFYSYDSTQNPWLAGGGAYRDLEVLSRLRRNFVAVHLYIGNYPGGRRQSLQGVEIIPLGFGGNEILSRLTYVVLANLRILFHKRGYIGIGLSLYSPLPVAWLHRKCIYGVLHHIIGNNWTHKLGVTGRLFDRLESLYYRIPNKFVVLNDAVAEEILRYNPKAQVLRTSNGFHPALLQVKDISESSPPFLAFIGRLDIFMKGLDILIEAFASVAAQHPKLKLVLAGRGDPESEKKLLALARHLGMENKVSLRTNITDAEKSMLLSQCLFFCSPSRYEGWGIAALEANAAGKVVVVSEASGFKNSISDGFSGIRVEIGNTIALSNAILGLLRDPERIKKMGLQAREWAVQFNWDAIADKEATWLEQHLGQ